ncbi:MAG: efflux transporter outer membrane subunit [Chlamydiales bacterium]|nr:efflux transporter outer membrane subunit [Chlamydiales bacterium]
MRPFVILLLFCAGCRPCLQPDISMEKEFISEDLVQKMEGGKVDLAQWWAQFDDPLLTELIEKGLEQNYDLRLAREKICQARAEFGIEFSYLLPQIDSELSFRRQRNPQTEGDSPFLGGGFENFYRTGFDAVWELDIFGKNWDYARAAGLDVYAQMEEVRNVNLSTTSEIAINYFIVRNLQDRIRITELHIASANELVETTNTRFEIGLAPELDVFTAKALLSTRLADLAEIEARLRETIYAIALLVGEMPDKLLHTFDQPREREIKEAKIPVGLPSELLCRRGDVRSAEFAMLASGARVMASRKELFPTLTLDTLFKYSTSFFTFWTTENSKFWKFHPILTLPIFQGGRIRSQIAAETSKQHQAVLEYEKTVLTAVGEVETALIKYFQEQIRVQDLHDQTAYYEEAKNQANSLYTAGLENFLFLFEVERNLYESQIEESVSMELLRVRLVAIYKALGGGWDCADLCT